MQFSCCMQFDQGFFFWGGGVFFPWRCRIYKWDALCFEGKLWNKRAIAKVQLCAQWNRLRTFVHIILYPSNFGPCVTCVCVHVSAIQLASTSKGRGQTVMPPPTHAPDSWLWRGVMRVCVSHEKPSPKSARNVSEPLMVLSVWYSGCGWLYKRIGTWGWVRMAWGWGIKRLNCISKKLWKAVGALNVLDIFIRQL